MINPKQLLKNIDQALTLNSILVGQLARAKQELEIVVITGQAMGDLDALESSVVSTVSRCGTAAEVRQIFLDWKLATGLTRLAVDTRGRIPKHEGGRRGSDKCVILAGPGENLTHLVNGRHINGNGHSGNGHSGNGHPKLNGHDRESTAEDHSYLRFL
jgi:hypothetical protein